MEQVLKTLLPALILLAVTFLPLTVVVFMVTAVKRAQKRRSRRSPLTDKLLHQAGAQARKRAEDLGDRIMERLVQLLMIGPLAMLVILLPRVRWSQLQFGWFEWTVGAGSLLAILWFTRQVVALGSERRQWLDGMRGEMASAQALDKLMGQGCSVVHDVPAEGASGKFNLDHVIVAPSAVYVVQTKSRRKPGTGKQSANARCEDDRIVFADGWVDTESVQQASAEADWLSKYLKDETGQYTPVFPVVALPGWYVKPAPQEQVCRVRVLNPKMAYELLKGSRPEIHRAQRNRIINALTKRYPDIED